MLFPELNIPDAVVYGAFWLSIASLVASVVVAVIQSRLTRKSKTEQLHSAFGIARPSRVIRAVEDK